MKVLAAAFVLATGMDVVTFVRMVSAAGLEAERNALVVHLAQQGVAVAIVARALLVVAVLAIAAVLGRTRYRTAGELMLVVGILVGAFGAGANWVVEASASRSALQPAPSTSEAGGSSIDGTTPSVAAGRTGTSLPSAFPIARPACSIGTGAAAAGERPNPDPSGRVSSRNGGPA